MSTTFKELKVGDPAPQFTLPNQDGEVVNLSDYKGKVVVLYFYPKDNTPGCTTEACSFRDLDPDFKNLDAVVLGISKDSVTSHKKFADKHYLPFTLLADEEAETCKAYGVYEPKKMFGKEILGIVRSTFLIDQEGKLARIWPKVKVNGHAEEVKEAVASLKS